ncbi:MULTISPECIES: two-partner secretion domain-containing protein [Nostocales]|nr:filamentous hemagglutinin N-terminal domain-containing protein [Tolypothrix bouteillei]
MVLAILSHKTLAQSYIVPDNTLGNESSQIIFNFRYGELPSEIITGGATRGINLFHSFQEFNVRAGRGAYFYVPNPNIQNIFARVSGNNPSEVLGVLGTSAASEPNLYLINPNGIFFGKNAQLDVTGSFVATTANAIQFPGGAEFSRNSAVTPQNKLLSVNPTAFLFNQIANQRTNSIEHRGYLEVPENKNLILLGGNIAPTQQSTGNILTDGGTLLGGRVEIGGLNAPGTIGLTVDGNKLALSFPQDTKKPDISLQNGSVIYGFGDRDTRDIVVNANNFNLINFSGLITLTNPEQLSSETQTGNIYINAIGSVNIVKDSTIRNFAFTLTNAPSINITAQSLNIQGSKIDIASNPSNPGSINLLIKDTISLFGKDIDGKSSVIYSYLGDLVQNNSGLINIIKSSNINIQATNLFLADGASILAGSVDRGNVGGDITIKAFNAVTLQDKARIATFNNIDYPTGNISIISNSLALNNNSLIFTENLDTGNAGDINIVSQNVNIDKSRIISGSESSGKVANAGNINIDTAKIILTNSGFVRTESNNLNPGVSTKRRGNINVKASELIKIDAQDPMALADQGTGFITRIGSSRSSGDITLSTKNLIVRDGGTINTGFSNNLGGNTGNIKIDASESIQLYSSGNYLSTISSTLINNDDTSFVSKNGNLNINTNRLYLQGGQILSANLGQGNAGNILIFTNDSVFIKKGDIVSGKIGIGNGGNISIFSNDAVTVENGSISSSTAGQGNAGNLDIQTRKLNVSNQGVISSEVIKFPELLMGGKGKAGTIRIDAADAVIVSGSDTDTGRAATISTATRVGATGQGGDIIINTGLFRLENGGLVRADTENSSNGGNMTINARLFEAFTGGIVSSLTTGSGKAGNITINTANDITISGINSKTGFVAGLLTGTTPNSSGNGGEIFLTANNLNLTEEAQISARSQGLGDAGNINIKLRENYIANNGTISANAKESGGGNIDITARRITLRNDSDIRTELSSGNGKGGNIFLTADTIITLEDSDILAFAPEGQGGNIAFNTRAVFNDSLYKPIQLASDRNSLQSLNNNGRSDINASGAIAGNIIGVPDISFIQNGLTELQTNPIDTNTLIANSCIARSSKQEGSFTITGTGGLPNRPGEAMASNYPTGDVQSVTNSSAVNSWKKGDPIIEPQGVYRLTNGNLVMSRECR